MFEGVGLEVSSGDKQPILLPDRGKAGVPQAPEFGIDVRARIVGDSRCRRKPQGHARRCESVLDGCKRESTQGIQGIKHIWLTASESSAKVRIEIILLAHAQAEKFKLLPDPRGSFTAPVDSIHNSIFDFIRIRDRVMFVEPNRFMKLIDAMNPTLVD